MAQWWSPMLPAALEADNPNSDVRESPAYESWVETVWEKPQLLGCPWACPSLVLWQHSAWGGVKTPNADRASSPWAGGYSHAPPHLRPSTLSTQGWALCSAARALLNLSLTQAILSSV